MEINKLIETLRNREINKLRRIEYSAKSGTWEVACLGDEFTDEKTGRTARTKDKKTSSTDLVFALNLMIDLLD